MTGNRRHAADKDRQLTLDDQTRGEQLRRIDAALVRIPEASHGIAARPSHLIAKVSHILAWFERYRQSGDERMASE